MQDLHKIWTKELHLLLLAFPHQMGCEVSPILLLGLARGLLTDKCAQAGPGQMPDPPQLDPSLRRSSGSTPNSSGIFLTLQKKPWPSMRVGMWRAFPSGSAHSEPQRSSTTSTILLTPHQSTMKLISSDYLTNEYLWNHLNVQMPPQARSCLNVSQMFPLVRASPLFFCCFSLCTENSYWQDC